jgi:hypothetical protein
MQKTIFFKIIFILCGMNCIGQSEILPRGISHFSGYYSSFLPHEMVNDSTPTVAAHLRQSNHTGIFKKVKTQEVNFEVNNIKKSGFNITGLVLNDHRGPFIKTTWLGLGVGYALKLSDEAKLTQYVDFNNVSLVLNNKDDFIAKSSAFNMSYGLFTSVQNIRFGVKVNYLLKNQLQPLSAVSNVLPFTIFHCAIINKVKKSTIISQANYINHSTFKDFSIQSKIKYSAISIGLASSYQKGINIHTGFQKNYKSVIFEAETAYSFPVFQYQTPQLSAMYLTLKIRK